MKRMAAISLLAVISLTVVTAQVSKTPFTIADLYRIQSVADPQISPDGRRIAFTVTTSDLVKGTTNADIHVVNLDGTGLRRLTASDKSDSTPRWSPDGKTLLFVSTRSDGAQLWLLPADGGEPRQLTRFSTGAADPVWTPDGQSVIFTSEIFPECGADDACNKRIQDGL
ncbi:MAG TPA: S9 family peptidase, partial [Acidobacteriota bacterium]|nr:S9 family peptidase [Acidobacteriota bacterium]